MGIKSIDVFTSVISDNVLLQLTQDVTIDGVTEEVSDYAIMSSDNAMSLSQALGNAARKIHVRTDADAAPSRVSIITPHDNEQSVLGSS